MGRLAGATLSSIGRACKGQGGPSPSSRGVMGEALGWPRDTPKILSPRQRSDTGDGRKGCKIVTAAGEPPRWAD